MLSRLAFDLPGYEVQEEITEGATSLILRAVRAVDGLSVVIKTLSSAKGPLIEAVRLYHEHEILRMIDHPGVIHSLGVEKIRGTPALILEDKGGVSLDRHMREHRLDVSAVLRITIQIVSALGQIHARKIVHKDLNPSNIILNPDTEQTTIIDFGIASQIPSEVAPSGSALVLEGTLSYMSPEQTGRMNRIIDYRADFYAFGVMMYELLIGWLPFQSSDPLELIHAHIARKPTPPFELNPGIPRTLSDIVMKLMAKNAEDRYQSAQGLQVDLEECLHQWGSTGQIDGFVPGTKDISDSFRLPQKLYGRQRAMQLLLDSFDRVCRERPGLLIINGPAGIGKSVLVRQLQEPILRRRGFFVTGKFDQFTHDTPYAPLSHAFRELIDHLLALGEGELDHLRSELHDAMGSLAGVLSAVIPETELLLGEQPPLEELPTVEAENRFKSAIIQFVRTVARKDRPLVVFVDDWQWADSASASLLRVLLSDEQTEGLMLIVAQRPDEAGPMHPSALALKDLAERGLVSDTIALEKLTESDITLLVADTLRCQAEDAGELSAMVAAKTEGNPYFVLEFLKSLHQDGLLRFNVDLRVWQWDIDEIRKQGITDNVVTLMASKIEKLPESTREGVSVAACIGSEFDLVTYAMVTHQTHAHAAETLWPAIQEGLILPVGDGYKFVKGFSDASAVGAFRAPENFLGVSYRFAHDRVQQAAYLNEPEERRETLHHEIARAMLGNGIADDYARRLFEIVAHFTLGRSNIDGDTERREVMNLLLLAGKRAKGSSAYAPALNYVTQGIELMRDDDWPVSHELCRDLILEQGECEYLVGHFAEAIKIFDESLGRFSNILDRARAYSLKIDLFNHVSDLDRAVDTGILALGELGVRLSRRPPRVALLLEMVKARLRVRNRSIEELIDLPVMKAIRPRLAVNLLMRLFGIAYSESEEFSALVVSKMLNLTLRHGNADVSAYSYGIYGLLLRAGFGAYSSGYQLGVLSVRLSEKFGNSLLRGRCNFVMGTLHNHWVCHVRTNLDYMETSYRLCFENGDLLYSSYAMSQRVIALLTIGAPLSSVEEKAIEFLEFVQSIRLKDIAHYFILSRQFVRNLQGKTLSAETFDGKNFIETEYRDSLDSTNYTPPRMFYRLLKMEALCIRGRYDGAIACARESKPLQHALIGQVAEWEFVFYYALSLAGSASGDGGTRFQSTLGELRRQAKKLSRWAAHCPPNLECRHLLVAAEVARLERRTESAMALYDDAIRSASTNEFWNVEAMANERAGRFHVSCGRERVAAGYLAQACEGFARWEATAKVRDLQREFGAILSSTTGVVTQRGAGEMHTSLTDTSVLSLDLLSVLKASQALSSEIILPRLLERMMSIVLENAGAERGVLISERNNVLVVEAERDIRNSSTRTGLNEPLNQTELASEAVVRYVSRSGQNIVVHDAVFDSRFSADPYISKVNPKSILCMPMLNQGALAGILYLENSLAAGVFTPDRVEVLRLLSSQIAVSLENARLHEQERELARMQAELRLAAKIQGELLPHASPALEGYRITGRNIPAQAVGGDYFDFIAAGEDLMAVTIGDVSGKGLPASLLMANLQATLRGQTFLNTSAAECLRRANRLLHESTSPEKYATLFYGILNLRTHEFQYCNAGHEFPLVIRATGGYEMLETGGIGLGMLGQFDYRDASLSIEKGDCLVMYTDGVTEAMNAKGELYGRDRLLGVLTGTTMRDPASTIERIVRSIQEHVGDTRQFDDITLVVMQRNS